MQLLKIKQANAVISNEIKQYLYSVISRKIFRKDYLSYLRD